MLLLKLSALVGLALAAPWSVDRGLVNDQQESRLRDRYKSIDSPAELENLLRDIDRRIPAQRLEARLENGGWVIHGERAAVVADIDLRVTTRALSGPLYAAVQNYLGQVDSPEIQSKVQDVLKRYLRKRGYPKARMKLAAEKRDDGVAYTVELAEGNPCVISRIELGFRLPRDAKLNVKPGGICDQEEIEAAVSELELSLRDRGYNQLKLELSDVVFDEAHDSATVYVSGVLGQRVRYEIVDSQKRFLIDDIFADEELTKVDPTIVGPDAMAAELARRYRNRGFSDVLIKGPEVRRAGEDEFVYVYNVDPGKQYILKSVQFEGVTVFTEEELLDTMGLKSLWQTSRPLNLEEVQQGLNALRAKYQDKGYWDAKVRDPGTGQKDKETGTVRLTIQVEEGLPRLLRGLDAKGNKALAESEIKELLKTPAGEPLDRSRLVDFQQDIRAAYQAKGFLYADVQIDLKAAEVKRRILVDVAVTINEGPRVRIGEITVFGLTRTDNKVVRRELLFQTGDVYDPERISLSRQSLTRLGLFRSVQILPTDHNAISNKEQTIDLTVDVREGKAGNVSFGPGWSLYRGWHYEAEAAYSNFGGVGRQASVRGSISEERNQEAIGAKTLLGRKIGAGYVEPWIFDLPVDLVIGATQKAEAIEHFWSLSKGGELALNHKLREILPGSTIGVFYGQKIARTEGNRQRVDELKATDVRIGSVGVRYDLDRRDNLRFPGSGYTLDTELAWARYGLGGDLRYFRSYVSTSRYFGILSDLVLAFNGSVTSYEGIQRRNEDLVGILPPSERLFTGGTDGVRGYAPSALGAEVRKPVFSKSGEPCQVLGYDSAVLGGSSRTIVKTELRYRITDSVAATGFIDSGAVFFSQDQMRKFQQAYKDPVDAASENPNCGTDVKARRSIEDNIGYDYASLLRNPEYLWSRHYYSYGTAFNLLTALGSVNLAYGLPWREPRTEACTTNTGSCYPRGKQGGYWFTRGEFSLDVGARF